MGGADEVDLCCLERGKLAVITRMLLVLAAIVDKKPYRTSTPDDSFLRTTTFLTTCSGRFTELPSICVIV
jgi:hypothetical protein